jgi:hypothetical protein
MAGDEYVKFLVRFPSSLLASLKRWADLNRRSLTGEIVYRLERSVHADERKERRATEKTADPAS